MDCAAEESDIRHALDGVAGIRSLRFHLTQRTLTIDAPAEVMPAAIDAVNRAGYPAKPVMPGEGLETQEAHDPHHPEDGHGPDHGVMPVADSGHGLTRYAAALAFAVGAELLHFFAPETLAWNILGMALAAVAIALAGFSTYAKGLAALRHARLNINALMTVAVTGAFLIGQWPEAAMVMALYAIAEWIEARAVDRARNAIQGLLSLTPETAEVRQADGGWVEQPAASVALGVTIRVKPGARFPLDGVITTGSSTLDTSAVTGESLPADKTVGDAVFAGTVNLSSTLEMRVEAEASNTLMARIIEAVEQAQGSRAPTQQFVDRFARIYTPAVFGLAVAVVLGLPLLMNVPWLTAVYKALVLLVIACPCALVISTPVSVVSGLASAARRGILIKGGVYLEDAHRIRAIAFDKTGTITEGRPRLVANEAVSLSADAALVQRQAAALAGHSDHPVSQAIAAGLPASDASIEAFTVWPGRGVAAVVDGQRLLLGNHRLIEERGLCSADLEAKMAAHEAQGRTVTLLASEHEVLALFAVADTIKPGSRDALAELRRLGVVSVMLTGDNQTTAKAIALEAGIDDARGDLLPEDKLAAIGAMQQRYGYSAMVGDGINDAPALAQADIGVAMGGAGTDIAMEAADVVIMNDDLGRIPETIRLSRRTNTVLRQNIALALGIKVIFLGLAVFDNASMWMAVFADMGASLLVVANGLRLLRHRP
ncbi:cation-translocating P-type ATPase [Hydrogenophaga sp. PAMC20947]|uniref:heavy metal translocating P-type ATPase n=1 Tax=Hydrogenophaga sp. PAMC20947 TaxID=2565558 RepID=UPI00109E2E59|nr:cation-translocating P-type ATPase [Hydrogenophaga sp. PAMC20947]QCB48773.1 cation-translocating P-type ATPase [Hydrogenophaga sp. PAMC20947]